jgi:hypothetical protein
MVATMQIKNCRHPACFQNAGRVTLALKEQNKIDSKINSNNVFSPQISQNKAVNKIKNYIDEEKGHTVLLNNSLTVTNTHGQKNY